MFSLRVRKQVGPNRFVKIGLQLYQVDQKSYLLDFRSFEPTPEEQKIIDESNSKNNEIVQHNMMEFLELCAGLIGSLAR